ncbi:hypothetical protein BpHYR1_001197 [Brachionus plicatilis]|uniref:Uncharacterized protein n=1 Tax=Brachionus plicatilis TaxID=10195 RepID=A0A3M7PAR6_BRAPC|nr:hypothetical protein BpHYR1_001197 [Brachionus plicatilis]
MCFSNYYHKKLNIKIHFFTQSKLKSQTLVNWKERCEISGQIEKKKNQILIKLKSKISEIKLMQSKRIDLALLSGKLSAMAEINHNKIPEIDKQEH